MNDLSQSKKYCFYTISDYIYCHVYLHNTIFVQYTIIQHHCQTCEIKYGKLLLLLRSDTPEEKHKSEITETSWERGKDFPEMYWKTNASQSWSELARAFQKQTNVIDLKSVYQLSECLFSSFAPLKSFLTWRDEKVIFVSHPSTRGSHSPSTSFFDNNSVESSIVTKMLWAMLSRGYKISRITDFYLYSQEQGICLGYF